jgi:class 3 adenylate cyclase/tetratricopeptide (TPR) repeat protein
VVCPHCGEHNPERARFCLNCGQPLGRVHREGEERKLVTVVFCDLVGFTASSDRRDPEDVKATLRPYHARLKQEIEHFGGTLDKFIGDGVLGVFGAPATHEDDPERAVRAALRIQESMAELHEALPDLQLAARAGVATGEAVVAFGEGPQIGENVTGDVVNTASRIQSVARPGAVVVAESTYLATRDAIDYEEVGPVAVKGKAEPLSLWRALSVRSRLGVGVDLHERHGTPFIGRTDEAALLKATYRRMLREASVQLVTVTGEPGVGKSRLLAELRSYIDELPEIVRWRQGRCLPYGEGITFWPLGEIVKAQAGILESDGPVEAEAKLESAVRAVIDDEQEGDWIRVRLAPLAGIDGGVDIGERASEADRNEAFTAWRRYLEALAAEYPLVLGFEDLQWADEPMLEFIDRLVEWSAGLPMLVVCASRPELYERHPEWGGGKRNSTTIPLGPLSERETSMLISALMEQAVLPPQTLDALLERSGGNPLYAEEFARMLVDRGILERHARELHVGPEAIPVPDSVQALVAARLDTLPQGAKALLHDAAVIGTVFWDGAVVSMSGRPLDEVHEALHDLARKEFVRPAKTSTLEGQTEYSFWHLTVRDVAYSQIPRAARGAKHRAAARWLEAEAGERLSDRADVLAFHYEQALELSLAAGDVGTEELREAAARFLAMAGDRALRLDVGRAEQYYRRALDMLPPEHPRRPRALVAVAKAESVAGRFDEAQRDAREAIELCRAAGDAVGEGECLAMLATALSKLGETSQARETLDEARRILEGQPPGPELVRVYSRTAGQRLVGGAFDESLAYAEKALVLAQELGLEDEAVRARQFRGAARCDLGDPGGLEDLWEALRQGLDLGLGEETALCYGNLAYQLWLKEGPEIALQVWSSAVEFAEVRGFGTHAMWGKAGMLEVLFDLGRWGEVVRTADEMIAWDRRTGPSEVTTFATAYLATVMALTGLGPEATPLVERFLPEARTVENPEFVAPAVVAAMLVSAAAGQPEQAKGLAEEFAALTEHQPGYRAQYLPHAARVLARQGRIDAAASLIPEEWVAARPRHRHAMASAHAVVAEAERRPDAAELYADAAHRWHEFGAVLEEAHARLGHGRSLVSSGSVADARDSLSTAEDLFGRLGMPAELAEVRSLLERVEALDPSGSVSSTSG